MIGTTLQNRYRLDAELGRGGMGVVYRAHDTVLDRDVAVKVLSSAPLDPEARARLLREARAAAQLNHPNIAGVYDAGEANGTPFIVMEFVEGESLHNRRPTALDDILSITRQICAALEHAQAHGIIHRDLKPENVLIAPDGTAKLMDFGLARSTASRLTSDGGFVGTVFYFAPEQALGHEIDGRADLYALGVMLYELATGRLPFTGDDPLAIISQHLHAPVEPPRTYRADLPAAVETIILGLLAKNPAERYASARDVATALAEIARMNGSGSVATPRHNLPHQLSSFIGREREIAEVKRLLLASRLVTLTGAGGSGKTRLALQVAADLLETFPDGVWLVELASLSDPALVPQVVASVLGVREQSGVPLMNTLSDYLRSRQTLLVLDNCEHLIGACAALAEAWLRSSSDLQILATSREAIGIPGETAWDVPSLSTPDTQPPDYVGLDAASALMQYEAARLFLDRARSVQPGFRLTEQNAPAVAEICQRLDGIPLAIELAAARMRALSVDQIAARLDDRFNLLTVGSRTALPRQQTLRATIDWSYELLSEAERTLFRRLSVFVGGFTLEAAERVTSDEWPAASDAATATRHPPAPARGSLATSDVLDLLTQLVNKSLALMEEQGGQARIHLLETIRQYAQEKLLESGEFVAVQTRHGAFCLSLAEQAELELRGENQVVWLDRLEVEHDNLRAALDWLLTRGNVVAELRLAGALYRFWYLHGYWSEGRDWLERALHLEETRRSGPPLLDTSAGRTAAASRAKALQGVGWLADESGNEADPYGESLTLCRELGDEWGTAFSLRGLGEWANNQADYKLAAERLEESLALFRELGDRWGIGLALFDYGWLSFYQDERQKAEDLFQESLDHFREAGDRWGTAVSLGALGYMARLRFDYKIATAFSKKSLGLYREIGDKAGIADSLSRLGNVAYRRGDFRQVMALFEESLALERELGYQSSAANSTSFIGLAAGYQGDYQRATALAEESLAFWSGREDEWGIVWAHYVLGTVAYFQGDFVRAVSHWETGRDRFGELEDKSVVALILHGLGLVAIEKGEYTRAAQLLEESLSMSRDSGDKRLVAMSLNSLGVLARNQGDYSRAMALYRESLSLRREMVARQGMAMSLEGMAVIAMAQSQAERAARLYGAAEGLREASGAPLPPVDHAKYEQALRAARAALGEGEFLAAKDEGRAMSLDQIMEDAFSAA